MAAKPSVLRFSISAFSLSVFRFWLYALAVLGLFLMSSSITRAQPSAFVPDAVFADRDGVLCMLSKSNTRVYRFSPTSMTWLAEIPLSASPGSIAYSAVNHRLFLSYGPAVKKIELTVSNSELPFATLPSDVRGMSAIGDMLMAMSSGSFWYSHFVYGSTGTLLSQNDMNHVSSEFIWNEATRQLFYYRDWVSPNDLMMESISAAGVLGTIKDSPYHGDYTFWHPIRVKLDGTRVLTGGGQVFSGSSMTYVQSISNSVKDAFWRGDDVVSLRDVIGMAQVQQWNGSGLALGTSAQFDGTPVAVLDHSDGTLMVTVNSGYPKVRVLNKTTLATLRETPGKPATPTALAVKSRDVNAVTLGWTDTASDESGVRMLYRVAGTTPWQNGTSTAANATEGTVSGLSANVLYEFQVQAFNAMFDSDASGTVQARTLLQAGQPNGEPYNLVATRVFGTTAELTWADNASNETGFRILQSTSATAIGSVVATLASNVRVTTITGLTPSTAYYFRVQAFNGAVDGELSSSVLTTTKTSDSAAPNTPSGLAAASVGAQSVTLRWTDTALNETGFIIERSGGGSSTYASIGTVGYNVTQFIDTAVSPATTYVYRVRAVNGTTTSASYTSLSVVTPKLGGTYSGKSQMAGNVMHLLFSGPNRIERYDVSAAQWLAAVPLNGSPTAMWVDSSGIYVGFDRSLVKVAVDGVSTAIINTAGTIYEVFAFDDVIELMTLGTSSGLQFVTIKKSDGLLVGTSNYFYNLRTPVVDVVGRRIFARSSGVSPSDIHVVNFGATGLATGGKDSPYHGSYPDGTKVFMSPDRARVFDDSGTGYSTSGLAYTLALGGSLTDMTWRGADVPVVLRGNTLIACSNLFVQTGSFTLGTATPYRIAAGTTNVFVFLDDPQSSRGLAIQQVPYTSFNVATPGQPKNPSGLAFTPDTVFTDKDGLVCLLSKAQQSIFRFSPTTMTWTSTLPLLGSPSLVAYSPVLHTVFLAYDRTVRKIDLTAGTAETDLVYLPTTVRALAAPNNQLFVQDSSGAWATHWVYSAAGLLLAQKEWNYYSSEFIWNAATQKLFFFRDGISPNDLLSEPISSAGLLGTISETPYHGDYSFVHPIRVKTDGSQVLIGTGVIFSGSALTYQQSIANAVSDAVWKSDRLVTLRDALGLSQMQTWSGPSLTAGAVAQLSGTPVSLQDCPEGVLLVSVTGGFPKFTILDSNLGVVRQTPGKPLAPASLALSTRTESSLSVRWADASTDEDGFRLQYQTDGGAWTDGPTTPANATQTTLTGLQPNTAYSLRVMAFNSLFTSAESNTLNATTLRVADQPDGEPYNFTALRVFGTSAVLNWTDNATNETAFRIYASDSPTSNGSIVATVGANETIATITGLTVSSTRYFRVQAVNGAIDGDVSSALVVNTAGSDSLPPSPPAGLTASLVSATSVTLRWTDQSLSEDGFKIERATGGVFTEVESVGFNVTTFTDTTVASSQNYSYRVRAFNANGASAYSSSITVSTPRLGGTYAGFAQQLGSVYCFVMNGPSRIERYDITAKSWLASVPLAGAPTAFWADSSGLYVVYGRTVNKVAPDGSSTVVLTAAANITDVFGFTDVIVALTSTSSYSTTFNTVRKSDGAVVETRSVYEGLRKPLVDPIARAVYLVKSSSSSKLARVSFDSLGRYLSMVSSPYDPFDYRTVTRVMATPQFASIFDDCGRSYYPSDLSTGRTLDGAITDIAYRGNDVPVVLRGTQIIGYSNTFQVTGTVDLLGGQAYRIATGTDGISVFSDDGSTVRGLNVRQIAFAELSLPQPDQPKSAVGLAFTPDAQFIDKDGVLNLFSRPNQSVFRFSPTTFSWLPTIPLEGSPKLVSYDTATHTLYLSYDRVVKKKSLADAVSAEITVTTLATAVRGLSTVGGYIFIQDDSGSWATHYVYTPAGVLVSSRTWADWSPEFIWNAESKKLFYFRNASPSDLYSLPINTNGTFGTVSETPYHGDYQFLTPIRVNATGTRVLTGAGHVFDGTALTIVSSLPSAITDGVWRGSDLWTLRDMAGLTQIQSWKGASLAPDRATQITAKPHALLDTSAGLLAITISDGYPKFVLLDASLAILRQSPGRPLLPTDFAVIKRGMDNVTLSWTDAATDEDGYQVQFRVAGTTAWSDAPSTAANAAQAVVSGLTKSTSYEFRLRASNSVFNSAWVAPVSARTLADPNQPDAEPYRLSALQVFGTTALLAWEDHSSNETGFRLYQSASAADPGTVIVTLPAGSKQRNISGLTSSTSYYFRVQAFNGSIDGDLSAPLNVVTNAGYPNRPGDPVLVSAASGSVKLAWQDNSLNEIGFYIERGPDWSTFNRIGSVNANVTTFTDDTVVPQGTYYYRIVAHNDVGETPSWNTLAVEVPKVGGTFLGKSQRASNIEYFAFDLPPRLERYDLASDKWLLPLPLASTPDALWVDDSGIYVAFGRVVNKISTSGGATYFASASDTVRDLYAFDDVLIISSSKLVTVRKSDGFTMGTGEYWYGVTGVSVDQAKRRVFGRDSSTSPSDIHVINFDAAGVVSNGTDSPFHGAFPGATRTFLDGTGTRVFDDAGIAYTTDGLNYAGSLGGALVDLDFRGNDVPIVLRDLTVTSHSNTLLETGRVALPEGSVPLRLATRASDVCIFLDDVNSAHGLRVQKLTYTALKAANPGAPKSPVGLAFTPDDVFADKNGLICMLSSANQSLFRYDPAKKNWAATIPLLGNASHAAYHASQHAVYLSYGSQIRKLDLATGKETSFANLPADCGGVAVASEFIFAEDASGAWATHWVFDSKGTVKSSVEWNYYSQEYIWSASRRQMFFFRDDQSPNDLHVETINAKGELVDPSETPYHGDYDFVHPIRLNPANTIAVLGSGVAFDTTKLEFVHNYEATFADIAWNGSTMMTLEPDGPEKGKLQKWAAYDRSASVGLSGNPMRLFLRSGGESVVLAISFGKPRFEHFDANLTLTFDSLEGDTPIIDFQPVAAHMDPGGTVTLSVQAHANSDLIYQWYRNGTLIDGATESTLVLDSSESSATGSFSVKVTSAGGEIESSAAVVTLGATRFFAEGNILSSDGFSGIYEHTPNGTLVRYVSFVFPPKLSAANLKLGGVTSDRFGRAHVVSVKTTGGGFVSTFDPATGQWFHHADPQAALGSTGSDADIIVIGDYLYTGGSYFDLNIWVRTDLPKCPSGKRPTEIALISGDLGAEGSIVGVDGIAKPAWVDTTSMTWGAPLSLSKGPWRILAMSGQTGSRPLIADDRGRVALFDIEGSLLRSATFKGRVFNDVDVNPANNWTVAGTRSAQVLVLNDELAQVTSFTVPKAARTYSAWVQPLAFTAPEFTSRPITNAVAGVPHRQRVSAYHTADGFSASAARLEAITLPAWLSFDPVTGILSGTPTNTSVDMDYVTIRAWTGSVYNDLSFVIDVLPLDPSPLVTLSTLTGNEDGPALTRSLYSALPIVSAGDGEDAYSIIGCTGAPVAWPSINQDSSLLSFPLLPDGEGSATVYLKVHSSTGNTYAKQIINILPVADTPRALSGTTFTAAALGSNETFNLHTIVSDPDVGDALTFTLVGTAPANLFESIALSPSGVLTAQCSWNNSGLAYLSAQAIDKTGRTVLAHVYFAVPDAPSPVVAASRAPTLNRSNSLYEQTIVVRNAATRAIPGFVLNITGLRPGVRIYNGKMVGTNAGTVSYEQPLAAGASVNVLIQYYSSIRRPFATPRISASILGALSSVPHDWTPSIASTTRQSMAKSASRSFTTMAKPTPQLPAQASVKGMKADADHSISIDFTTKPGTTYQIEYSDDLITWKTVSATITAGGTTVRWSDIGAPFTKDHPALHKQRFYRVRSLAP